ncbi:hypothetical protein EUTSA_v10015449mg [Eutrema salsugineum]|uniref:EF-hand domain-containing protein n=1 Tax=Eutrema salsugineum TaxID=72664 RepID=V4N7R3_EUTSA|nr:hypothetical protein EUTSA_v10015449mg [Eutrema salsugineum]
MSKAKDFKEAFKKLDQFNNGEISESEFNVRGIIGNDSTPMTMSAVDNVIGELGADGEDRVFGASTFLVRHRHLSQALINEQLKKESRVFNPDELKNDSCVFINPHELKKEVDMFDPEDNENKTENQLQVSKKHVENQLQVSKKHVEDGIPKDLEDWVVIENNDLESS